MRFRLAGWLRSVDDQSVAQLAGNLPRYQFGIEQKINSVRAEAIEGPLARSAARILDGLRQPLQRSLPAPEAGPTPAPQGAPEPRQNVVVMRQPAATPFDIAAQLVGPLIAPFATAGVVVVFVVFILIQREDLRDRLIWLAGARDLRRTTIALDDAGARLSRYLLAQTAINTAFGFLVGVGLWLIGIPNFLLWGSFAALLRFLPYIGGPLAAICPLFLAAAVDPGWWTLVWTAGLFVVLEAVVGQVIEPLLFGRTAGMSPLAVIAAATFWAWLWGPIGLIMSMPLTLLLVTLGQHTERFSFLTVLFGDAPPLSPGESFYHKVIAGHDHEAIEQSYKLQQARSLTAYYDDVALPGLHRLQSDLNNGLFPPDDRARIVATIDRVVEMANEYEDDSEGAASESDREGQTTTAAERREPSRADGAEDAPNSVHRGTKPARPHGRNDVQTSGDEPAHRRAPYPDRGGVCRASVQPRDRRPRDRLSFLSDGGSGSDPRPTSDPPASPLDSASEDPCGIVDLPAGRRRRPRAIGERTGRRRDCDLARRGGRRLSARNCPCAARGAGRGCATRRAPIRLDGAARRGSSPMTRDSAIASEQFAKLLLRAFKGPLALRGKIAAGAIDVHRQHRHRGPERRRLAPVAILCGAFERSGDRIGAPPGEDSPLEVKGVRTAGDLGGPFSFSVVHLQLPQTPSQSPTAWPRAAPACRNRLSNEWFLAV